MEKTKYKYLFFDLDGTLTRSRSPIAPEMKAVLAPLPQTIIVISGQPKDAIEMQLDGARADYVLGQNGNSAFHGDTEIWKNALSEEERREILDHIGYIDNIRNWDVSNSDDLVEDRGNQISYSFVGHHANVSQKEAFDPRGTFRQKIIDENPRPLHLTDVKIAGTTCIDYFKKGSSKGENIKHLIEHEGWNKKECLFFGNALYKGGGDETVMGIIDVQQVNDYEHTLKLLKEHYSNQ